MGNSLTKDLFLYYNTIKYMRCRQILWRIFFLIKKGVYKRLNTLVRLVYINRFNGININNDYNFFDGIEALKKGKVSSDKDIWDSHARIDKIAEKRTFNFLNKTVSFPGGIKWNGKGLDKLWLYNLHYFDYAFDLGIANIIEKKETYFKTFKYLVLDWITKNQKIGCGYGWEPYPLSLRIVNWIYSYSLFRDEIRQDKGFETGFLKSLALQCEFLSKNIEYHISRNHLIKNGKALFLAGCFLKRDKDVSGSMSGHSFLRGPVDRPAIWLKKGLRLMLNGIEEQVLEDGGHYERSPMYHLIVLQDYLEMFILARRNNINLPIDNKLRGMLLFLVNIAHPDNQIPLFNDAAFGISKEPGELLAIGSFVLTDMPFYPDIYKITLYTILLTGVTGAKEEGAGDTRQESGDMGQRKRIERLESKGSKFKAQGRKRFEPFKPLEQFEQLESFEGQMSKNGGEMATDSPAPSLHPTHSLLFKDSGFCTIRSKNNDKFLIISCKAPSPSYLPGHSHSDIFSYELSLGNKRFIIDSGVSDYSPGRWRRYFRGTRAHNTVSVNGEDQSELWGIFGIARRPRLQSLHLQSDKSNIIFFHGSFKGFPSLPTICHQRRVFFVNDLFWVILDAVYGDGGEDMRHYRIENFIHVHPDRDVKVINHSSPAFNIIIQEGEDILQISPVQIVPNLGNRDDATLKIINGDEKEIQGWYSPEFGSKMKNNVIIISKEGRLPVYMGYLLFPASKGLSEISASCSSDSDRHYVDLQNDKLVLEITISGRRYFIEKDRGNINLITC